MNKFKQTLTSRKFLATLAGVIVVIGNQYFGLHLSNDSVLGVVTMVSAYVLGTAYEDGKNTNK
jgi:hypothetical protein